MRKTNVLGWVSTKRKVVAVCFFAASASAFAGDWSALALDWNPPPDSAGAWQLGSSAGNPMATLPLQEVLGHWVRITSNSEEAGSGILPRLNLWDGKRLVGGSVAAKCTNLGAGQQCSTVLWVPPDAHIVQAVAWASAAPGRLDSLQVELSTAPGVLADPDGRLNSLLSLLQANYYRTSEVDWTALAKEIARLPALPQDVDILPPVAQMIRDRLPGNKHMLVTLSEPSAGIVSVVGLPAMPSCEMTAGGVGVIAMPGVPGLFDESTQRYAVLSHDCLMGQPAGTSWLIDLRANSGGNMYPMIAGLSPLLHEGGLYDFVDGKGKALAHVRIDPDGLSSNATSPKWPAPDVGQRSESRVVVILGPHCGSSCEQTANALSSREGVLFVGEATAGYLTANSSYPLTNDYVLLLTESFTANPCGEVIQDRLHPNVVITRVGELSAEEVLANKAVTGWLAKKSFDGEHLGAKHCEISRAP